MVEETNLLQGEQSLDVWREQVERARSVIGSSAPFTGAARIYVDFLDSMFYYYGENAKAAERATREG